MRRVSSLRSRTGGGVDGAATRASRRRPLKASLTPSIPMLDFALSPPSRPLPPLPRSSSSRRSVAWVGSRKSTRTHSSNECIDPTPSGDAGTRNAAPSPTSSSPSPSSSSSSKKPRLRALVVVEGPSDARAVLRAVDLNPGCHSLGGATWARNERGMEELVKAAERAAAPNEGKEKPAAVVLLLDPDAPGRVARGEISRELLRRIPPKDNPSFALYHAFIPPAKCRAAKDVGGKSAGDTGVEHASPGTVLAALRSARRHRGGETERRESSPPSSLDPPPAAPLFSMDELERARLATSFDAGSQQTMQKKTKKGNEEGGEEEATLTTTTTTASPPPSTQKTSDRRRRFCDALGLGPCTGAQLLKALNEWGLTRGDWEVGMRAAEAGEEGGGVFLSE